MDADLHSDILDRLETIKAAGMISDYWVSWVGTAGKLEPLVRIWVGAHEGIQNTQKRLSNLLDGLVSRDSIAVQTDIIG